MTLDVRGWCKDWTPSKDQTRAKREYCKLRICWICKLLFANTHLIYYFFIIFFWVKAYMLAGFYFKTDLIKSFRDLIWSLKSEHVLWALVSGESSLFLSDLVGRDEEEVNEVDFNHCSLKREREFLPTDIWSHKSDLYRYYSSTDCDPCHVQLAMMGGVTVAGFPKSYLIGFTRIKGDWFWYIKTQTSFFLTYIWHLLWDDITVSAGTQDYNLYL